MAVLHSQFTEFNKQIKLTPTRKESLKKSRKEIKAKIKKWFKENKSNELQPKFWGQGSFEMNTIINPIIKKDEDGNDILEYDLDYGVYFIEIDDEDNIQSIDTWHSWVSKSVENHTSIPPKDKTTCVRVIFSDGHHIDLPIYYKNGTTIELAHKSKGWLLSDPKEFFEWFNEGKNKQLERIVRYLKAWKNFRQNKNTNLKLPSGFELTILATNNYCEQDNDGDAFRRTVEKINTELNKTDGFKCLRPTIPVDEDIFSDYSDIRKNDFLDNFANLLSVLNSAKNENNRKKASEYIRKQLGDRFPLGPDVDDETQSSSISSSLVGSTIKPKPYSRK